MALSSLLDLTHPPWFTEFTGNFYTTGPLPYMTARVMLLATRQQDSVQGYRAAQLHCNVFGNLLFWRAFFPRAATPILLVVVVYSTQPQSIDCSLPLTLPTFGNMVSTRSTRRQREQQDKAAVAKPVVPENQNSAAATPVPTQVSTVAAASAKVIDPKSKQPPMGKVVDTRPPELLRQREQDGQVEMFFSTVYKNPAGIRLRPQRKARGKQNLTISQLKPGDLAIPCAGGQDCCQCYRFSKEQLDQKDPTIWDQIQWSKPPSDQSYALVSNGWYDVPGIFKRLPAYLCMMQHLKYTHEFANKPQSDWPLLFRKGTKGQRERAQAKQVRHANRNNSSADNTIEPPAKKRRRVVI